MILDQPSKLSQIYSKKSEEAAKLTKQAQSKLKELIQDIGLAGMLQIIAQLCAEECSTTDETTLNYIAFELDILASKVAHLRNLYKIVKREKEIENKDVP